MSGWVVALLALLLAAPPLGRGNSLQVATAEPELGMEIAKAARRYLNGTIQVRTLAAAQAESGAAHDPCLIVREDPARTTGQRWSLVLSSGPSRQVRRVLALNEAPSRFDLAEAVAIGLPDMLARLQEQAMAPPPHEVPAVHHPPAVSRVAMAMVPRPPPSPHPFGPPVESAPSKETSREQAKEGPAPPTVPPSPAPPAAPPEQPLAESAPEPPAAEPPSVPKAPLPAEHRPERTPLASIVLTAGGAVVLGAGLGMGIAAMITAQEVDAPAQNHFDRGLDTRGKDLNTATIVLDCVGGASLAAGGAWLLAHAVKSRRSAPRVFVVPTGHSVVLGGRF